ncbi:MAG TPA: (d)CMP kinase [Stellaceae bacterium]|nr:(d)CMP kinase [Stellaceae bacterium]
MGALVIAVDGSAASGKGTLARRLARHFGLAYLETGGLYRATALKLIESGGDPADEAAAARAAGEVKAEDLADPRLREERVAQGASIVAAIPGVRAALLGFQRAIAARPPGAVLDGRDIGTVVCPEARAKLFLTASIEARATRRLKELRESGNEAIYERVLKDMIDRDARDSGRRTAPSVPAPDALILDTTTLDADAAFARALDFIGARLS